MYIVLLYTVYFIYLFFMMKMPVLMEESIDLNPVEKSLVKEDLRAEETEDLRAEENENTENEINLINEGAYGCIYYPGINCKGRIENKKYITKIQKNTEVTENEWDISQRVAGIPGFQSHFAPILKQCPVKIAKKYVHNIRQCEVFKSETEEQIESDEYVSNKIRFLGKENLNTYLYNILVGKYPPYHSMKITRFFWKRVIETHIYILKSVYALLKNKIIHFDIKNGNIMMDPNHIHPILIDFGISIHRTNSSSTDKNAFYIFDTYTSWPFDVLLCNYIVKKVGLNRAKTAKVSELEIDMLIKAFETGIEETEDDSIRLHTQINNDVFSNTLVSSTTLDKFRKRIKHYMISQFVNSNNTWEDVYNYMNNNTYTTWDSYAVSATYLIILDNIKQSNPLMFERLEHEGNIYTRYKELLEKDVFAIPEKRLSIRSMIERLRALQTLPEMRPEKESKGVL